MGPTQYESTPSPIPRPADSAARRLHPSNDDDLVLDTGILGEIAGGLAEAIDAVEPVPAGTVERIPLLSTHGYDAWLMVWGPGAVLQAHDHDGSIGVMHVIEGELHESAAELDDDEPPSMRVLLQGETTEFAAAVRHALSNPGTGATVSVGVYSPPLGRDAWGASVLRAPSDRPRDAV